MSEDRFAALAEASMQRIVEWDLTKREKLIAGWIVELSYKRGRLSVYLLQQHIARLTGLDKGDVSRAIGSLQRAGVLQVMGPRLGAREYTLLPNAGMIAPRAVADPADVRRAVGEVEEMNASGPGFDPGGQGRLNVTTEVERLDVDLAEASRQLALERTRAHGPPGVGKTPTRELVNHQLDPASWQNTNSGALIDAGAHPRDVNVNVYGPTAHVYVGCEPLEGDSRYALELVEQMIPPAEFAPWRMKWMQRCREAPHAIIEAAGDTKMYAQRNKIKTSIGATLFRRAKMILASAGKNLRLFC